MKKYLLILALPALGFSSVSFAAENGSYSILDILNISSSSTISRRCVNDGGCRPGAEICAGGQCVPSRGEAPRCRVDRDCTPRKCVSGRCQ